MIIMADRAVSSGYVVVDETLQSILGLDGQADDAGAAELGNNVTNLTLCLVQLNKTKTLKLDSVITVLYYSNCKRFQNFVVS